MPREIEIVPACDVRGQHYALALKIHGPPETDSARLNAVPPGEYANRFVDTGEHPIAPASAVRGVRFPLDHSILLENRGGKFGAADIDD